MSYVIADEDIIVRQRRTIITNAFSKNAWQVVTAAHRPAEDAAFREVTKKTILSAKIKFNLPQWEYSLEPSKKEPRMSDFLWRVYLTELEVMRRNGHTPLEDVCQRELLQPHEASYLLDLVSLIMTVRDLLKLDPLPPMPKGVQARYQRIKSGIVNFEILRRHSKPITHKKKAA
jgi:hypothetical protein